MASASDRVPTGGVPVLDDQTTAGGLAEGFQATIMSESVSATIRAPVVPPLNRGVSGSQHISRG